MGETDGSAGAEKGGKADGTEPWMRGTYAELDVVRRGVVHALEQAAEDGERWCGELTTPEVHARPSGLPPVAFHLRHAVRSLDRLLTYAEDASLSGGLSEGQRAALQTEMDASEPAEQVRAEYRAGLAAAIDRVLAFEPSRYEERRGIGRARLPTTLGGLLVHCAEHTQRHVGQVVLTARLARRDGAAGGGDEAVLLRV